MNKYSKRLEIRITEDMDTALGLYAYYHNRKKSSIARAIINYFFENRLGYDGSIKSKVNIGEYVDRF